MHSMSAKAIWQQLRRTAHTESLAVRKLTAFRSTQTRLLLLIPQSVEFFKCARQEIAECGRTFKTLLKLNERISSPPAHIELCSRTTTTWTYEG